VVLSFCDRTNIDVLLACNRASLPLVISERSDPARQSLGPFWDSVRRRVYRRASAVIALTETAAKHLRPFSRSVHVVHSAIDAPPLLSNREQASRRKVIVGAGRLEQEKGFDRLLKAFAKATDDAPDWQLVIYGEGSQHKQLVRQASILGIQDRVDFPGWVRPLAEPLSEATLFCLSSRYEGFPSVLLEAMSMGVPVISVDCESGPRVIVDHGRNGLLVDPSVDGLAEGMTRLIKDRAERERLGREGKSVVEQFKWETMVDRYEAILRNAATQT
jgi:glycosyltransferase involved in cell wall biosynthesis